MIKELTVEKKGLPVGWEMKTLGEVCSFQNGFAFKSKTYKDDGIPVVRITNIQDESIDLSKIVYIDPKDYNKDLSKYKIIKGDLLIAMSGATTGKIGIHNTDEELLLNQRVGKFEPFDNLNKSYLLNFLKTKVEESLAISAGAAQPNLSTAQIKSFQIPLPPLPQQKQIVATLDNAFAAIDTAKANAIQNLQNAKELFESYLQNVFEKIKANGQLYSLANYLDLITYGFTNPMPTTDEGPYKVTAKDVKYGIVNYKTARRTSQDAFDNLIRDKCKPKKGDVLLTKDGTLGRLAVVEKANMCINQSVALLRPTKELDSYYLKELLSSKFYQELMIEQAGGATIKHIYITRVDKMLVPVPSITEQLAIIKKLDALSSETKKLETIYTKKIADLEEMKKSVLQKAFSGQLNTIN